MSQPVAFHRGRGGLSGDHRRRRGACRSCAAHRTQHGVGDCAVSLGAARRPCRFLADHLPEEGVEQRRRPAYETARKQGRPPTHAYVHWFQYGWDITHVGATVWAAEVVATVYRIRWPIAWLLKQWKAL